MNRAKAEKVHLRNMICCHDSVAFAASHSIRVVHQSNNARRLAEAATTRTPNNSPWITFTSRLSVCQWTPFIYAMAQTKLRATHAHMHELSAISVFVELVFPPFGRLFAGFAPANHPYPIAITKHRNSRRFCYPLVSFQFALRFRSKTTHWKAQWTCTATLCFPLFQRHFSAVVAAVYRSLLVI